MAFVVGAFEREVGGGVADVESAFARIHPERLERKDDEGVIGNVAHGAREEVGALAHGEEKCASSSGIENGQHDDGD